MTPKIETCNVQVFVKVRYLPEYSNPQRQQFQYEYEVVITNQNRFPIKIESRVLKVFDYTLANCRREVRSKGVIGIQPIIQPKGLSFTYTSSVTLNTAIGSFTGGFLMVNMDTGERFMVDLPEVNCIASFLNN